MSSNGRRQRTPGLRPRQEGCGRGRRGRAGPPARDLRRDRRGCASSCASRSMAGRSKRRTAKPSSAPRAATASSCRICAIRPSRLSPRRQLPRLHGGDRGRARARGKLHPHAHGRHEGQYPDRPRQDRAAHGDGAPACGPAAERRRARSAIEFWKIGRSRSSRREPVPARARHAPRPQPSRHGGQSRCLHPVQPVRPRLPRGAGQ